MCTPTRRSPRERDAESTIEEFPPSAKLVYKTLEYEGPLTQKALRERTRLPGRTARDALSTLVERGYVDERPYTHDARQRLYVLKRERE